MKNIKLGGSIVEKFPNHLAYSREGRAPGCLISHTKLHSKIMMSITALFKVLILANLSCLVKRLQRCGERDE